jgi:hypothetical protein
MTAGGPHATRKESKARRLERSAVSAAEEPKEKGFGAMITAKHRLPSNEAVTGSQVRVYQKGPKTG